MLRSWVIICRGIGTGSNVFGSAKSWRAGDHVAKRRSLRGFSTFPPSPPKLKIQPSKFQRYSKRAVYVTFGLGTIYVVDKYYNASAILRNLRTLWTVRDFVGIYRLYSKLIVCCLVVFFFSVLR